MYNGLEGVLLFETLTTYYRNLKKSKKELQQRKEDINLNAVNVSVKTFRLTVLSMNSFISSLYEDGLKIKNQDTKST